MVPLASEGMNAPMWTLEGSYTDCVKSRPTDEEITVDNTTVTTAFLVHQLGMVAAEEAVVCYSDTATSEDVRSPQTQEQLKVQFKDEANIPHVTFQGNLPCLMYP